jgi:hypothetical protein
MAMDANSLFSGGPTFHNNTSSGLDGTTGPAQQRDGTVSPQEWSEWKHRRLRVVTRYLPQQRGDQKPHEQGLPGTCCICIAARSHAAGKPMETDAARYQTIMIIIMTMSSRAGNLHESLSSW